MRNVIIDPGIIPVENVKNAIGDSLYNVYLFQHEWRKSEIVKLWPEVQEIPFCVYEELKSNHKLKHSNYVKEHYTDVFNCVISDFRTLLIAERVNKRILPWQNCFDDIIIISNLVTNYLDCICELNPAFVFFEATPHDIYSYTLGKVAEFLGIPVYMMDLRLPWKSYLVKGIDSHTLLQKEFSNIENNDIKYIDEYFQKNSRKYDEAITPYERDHYKARKGKTWSWGEEMKECFKGNFLRNSIALVRKYNLYKYYQSLIINDIPFKDYVVVFLHFQPERTTLPEAQFFVQQLNIVRTLQLSIPNCKILVKEHPHTFVGKLNIKYRSKEFYRSLSSMENVYLIDSSIDTFSLVDNSLCIATVRGTVGLQALIRGKQVLCFGLATYTDFEGCYVIHSCKDVEDAIQDIKEKNRNCKYNLPQMTLEKLHSIDKSTISGIRDRDNVGELLYNLNYKLAADGVLFEKLLKGQIIKIE